MKINIPSPLLHGLAAAALVAMAGSASSNMLDVPNTPLYLGSNVKPNFILAIDDSTSMYLERDLPGGDPQYIYWDPIAASFFEAGQPGVLRTTPIAYPMVPLHYYLNTLDTMFDSLVGQTVDPIDAYAFMRSPDFNSMYFHPARTYLPWLREDGSRWPDAVPSKTASDPRLESGIIKYPAGWGYPLDFVDLTDQKGFVPGPWDWNTLDTGMVIRAGTPYYAFTTTVPNPNDPDNPLKISRCGDDIPPTDGELDFNNPPLEEDWGILEKDATVQVSDINNDGTLNGTDNCQIKLRTFLPTFFLKNPASLPEGYGYVASPREVPNAFGSNSESLWEYEIRPANFASAEQYQAAIQNYANYFQYHRNRFFVTIAALSEAMSDIDNVRMDYFRINDRIDVQMMDMSLPLQRKEMYKKIVSLDASAFAGDDYNNDTSQTPNRDAVAHIGQQFRRTDENAPIQMACQINSGMLFTDGLTLPQNNGPETYGNADGAWGPPFQDSFSNTMADIVASYYDGANTPLRTDAGFPPGQVPVPSKCKEGAEPWMDCETDLHMKFYGVAFGPDGAIYGTNQAATENPFTNPPNWDALGSPKTTKGPLLIDELWHATINGRGTFVNASTPDDVAQAFRDALLAGSAPSFTGGSAASSSRRDEGFLSYVPRYFTDDWTGDVTAHTLDEEGNPGTPVWSAAEKLAEMNPAERNIYFVTPGKDQKLLEFTATNIQGAGDVVSLLGLPGNDPYGHTVEEIVDYLRGDHSLEKKNGKGDLRDRSARLGDIFGSQPDVLTAAGFGYSGLPADQGGGKTYQQFVEFKKERTPVLFVGANDGMLHAFDASAGDNGGKELFAIIPSSVLSSMGQLPNPAYQHRFFVDGSPVQGDAWNGTSWKTVLIVPMGLGGKSIVALDVTDPAKGFTKENFLWEFTAPGLDWTTGRPHIVLLKGGRWAAVFTSGLDDAEDPSNSIRENLYAVDLFTGELISDTEVYVAQDTFHEADGLMSMVPVDTDFDLYADTVYAADYDGYIWKFRVGDDSKVTLDNGGQHIFRAGGDRPQRITGGLDSFPHHLRGQMVFFGSGRYLNAADAVPKVSDPIESFYGIWDDPENGTAIQMPQLLPVSILGETSEDGVTMRQLSDQPMNWLTHRGWVLELKHPDPNVLERERFIGQPSVLLGNVVFTTFSPRGDQCAPGGINRLYVLSATSGSGEYRLGGGDGVFGSGELPASAAGTAPVLSPPVVTTPPTPTCIPGTEGCDTPPLSEDDDANVLQAPSAGCRTALGALLGGKLWEFGRLTCGRQSWSQSR